MARANGFTRASCWNTLAAPVVCGCFLGDEFRELLREMLDVRFECPDFVCLLRRLKRRTLDMKLGSCCWLRLSTNCAHVPIKIFGS